MGNVFVGKVLLSIAGRPASKPVEAELEPIQPGAWATWAKAYADERTTAAVETRVKGKTPRAVPAMFPR